MELNEEASRRGRRLRILVSRLRFLGDVIITTPVIKALKECYPEAEIYYLAQEEYASVLEENPFLEGVLALRKGAAGTFRIIREIRDLRFTAALDLFYNPRSANILFLSGIPIRIGGSRKFRKRLYTDNFSVSPEVRSAVRHHLCAMEVIGCEPGEPACPRVYLRREEVARGREILKNMTGLEPESSEIITIHPGGTWQAKRWPPELFAALIDKIYSDMGAEAVLITGPGEEGTVEQVAGSCSFNPGIIPFLPVRKAAAVMAVSSAVIANDGGIMHLAVALNKPTVGIFGPTEPDIWFPYSGMGPFRLATVNKECAPCHRHYCENPECLTDIAPGDVYRELMAVRGG
ncbi:MAG: glycosyltransferase family 9 protein [Candidatus Krumholzibacteriales bacterium]